MADVANQIERLVREVLAELGYAPKPETTKGPSHNQVPSSGEAGLQHNCETGSKPVPTVVERAAVAPGELVVGCRVVTLAELGERLDGVRRLVVPPQALVTPLVRDELRRRNVELVFGSPSNGEPTQQGPSAGLVMFVHGKKFDVASLVKALADGGIAVEPQQSDCIIASTDQLAQRLAGGGTLGVLLTQHTAAGVCLANRHPGVRAIVGRDLDSASADAASVGANLLIVDAKRNGTYRTRQIIGQFYRQGPQQCPKVFEKQLK